MSTAKGLDKYSGILADQEREDVAMFVRERRLLKMYGKALVKLVLSTEGTGIRRQPLKGTWKLGWRTG